MALKKDKSLHKARTGLTIDRNILNEMVLIAKKEKRSLSNLTEILYEEYILKRKRDMYKTGNNANIS
ncbi:MAG: hypothetical protein ACPG45_10740 [Flavobacteriaceae bacterium]